MALVPEARKAQAVKAALEGPVTEGCPASILRTQPNVKLYLDGASAALVKLPD
jgi:glucosamine-6-phosphate deaminase